MEVRAVALLVAAVALAVGGCGGDGDRTVRVFAASSLTESFTELAERFEAERPDVDVEVVFAGSSSLVAQVADGAPVDVVATADTATMDRVIDSGRAAGLPVTFASNRLVIAVPDGNPAGVRGLADLVARDLDVVVCAPEVPCGAYTEAATPGAGLDPVSFERSVRGVVTKVLLGEADAGIVYRTDVAAIGGVDEVPLPEADGINITYPIVTIDDSADGSTLGADFVELVRSDAGREILAAAGFETP